MYLKNFRNISKEHRIVIGCSFFLLLTALFFRDSLYGIFGEQNYLTIHVIMEIFIVSLALTIAIQSWVVFPHSLSRYRLWVGALFFSVWLLELAHAIAYKGMPFFLSESSTYKATWFFIATRLTEAVGMLLIVVSKDNYVASNKRFISYSFTFLYTVVWLLVIFFPTKLLPELVVEGMGTTALKNNLQYFTMFSQMMVILLVVVRSSSKEIFSSMLIYASVFLIISDYFFTAYKSVYDINNFIGHLLQLAGFYFLQRAVYHTAVIEPFQKKAEAENRLMQNKKYLQTITSHMGEGLIVLDVTGNVTYMNLEAERITQWSHQDLIGENFHDVVHRKLDGENYLFCKFPKDDKNKKVMAFQENDDVFTKKNGDVFPVSYVVTPLYEFGQIAGSIMVFQDITQQKKDQELIKYMAYYDELTRIPNLRFLKDKLAEYIDPSMKTAIILFDIDRFKKINEALGHACGDSILQATAARINQLLSPNMVLVRLTGDEFALIQHSIIDEKDIETTLKSVQNAFIEPIEANRLLINITLSAGVSIYPSHGQRLEELLQHANMALTEAQQHNTVMKFYNPQMDGKAFDHLVIENDLFHALSKNELSLVYQPQINIQTGKIIGVEALLRWNHTKQGFISPAKFIPIAEDTGLIIPIGEWVLRTACKQLKEWQEQGSPPLIMAVNLSIRQFYQQNLVETIKGILKEVDLKPHFLELEITESMMMNREHTLETLQALKDIGIQIAIDDFGTGYSSLSYLKDLPFDRLKIDQSFVRDLQRDENDTTIVETIISMAHHFNLTVIAEGVETEKQKEILYKRDCKLVQGYFFSPPLPAKELMKQMERIMKKVDANNRNESPKAS